jgi:hypothetical protein
MIPRKTLLIALAVSTTLVTSAYYNVVLHENGWALTFVLWPGILVDFLMGGNFHNGLQTGERVITFLVSLVFWLGIVVCIVSACDAGLRLLKLKAKNGKELTKQ